MVNFSVIVAPTVPSRSATTRSGARLISSRSEDTRTTVAPPSPKVPWISRHGEAMCDDYDHGSARGDDSCDLGRFADLFASQGAVSSSGAKSRLPSLSALAISICSCSMVLMSETRGESRSASMPRRSLRHRASVSDHSECIAGQRMQIRPGVGGNAPARRSEADRQETTSL
jgi:hypothetical protein